MEGAGVVQEVGSSVKNFNKGDRVTYSQMPLDRILTKGLFLEKLQLKYQRE